MAKEKCNECMKKYSPSERREINKAFEKLKQMIAIKEQYGIPFEKIFKHYLTKSVKGLVIPTGRVKTVTDD